jgi:radical SAM superfamily enzyme YgiQ (UPF0313 family)
MNALLLYPGFPDTFWSLKHALKFIRKRSVMPPLGLLTVAAMLPRGWNLRLIDTNVQTLTQADLAWADMAFISAMAVQKESALRLIARCRAAHLTVVAGGPMFTAEHDAFRQVDHLVLNEAERTLPPFLADLQAGHPQRVYRSGRFADLHHTPTPMWSLLNMRHYGFMGVQYSRGCPFDCEFCDVTALFGRKPRVKSPAQICEELNSLERAGWKGPIFFVDDNLVGNKRAVRDELLPALIEWRRTHRAMTFNTQASINIADDPRLLDQLARAGFDTVFVGIETPDDRSLMECGKAQNQRRDLLADVKRIQRAGIQVQAGFIVGFDTDSPSIFQRQIDFIQNSGIVTAMVGILQALPGTRLYERLRHENRLLGAGDGNNVHATTNIVPKMNLQSLLDGYRRIVTSVYSPRAYYRRVRAFLRECGRPQVTARLDRERIMAFARSVVRIGVLGRERFQYWHLLAWTLLHRPTLFARAVTLAISGHHFRRVFESALI